MTPETIAEVSSISAAIVAALREAHEMARQGRFGDELNELVRHAREMCEVMMSTIEDLGTFLTREGSAARAAAEDLLPAQRQPVAADTDGASALSG